MPTAPLIWNQHTPYYIYFGVTITLGNHRKTKLILQTTHKNCYLSWLKPESSKKN